MKIESVSRDRIVCILAVALVAFAFVGAGCSVPAFPPPPATPAAAAPSGYTAGVDGSVEATGYVVRSELEGGFWAIQDVPVGPSSQVQPKILTVLLPGTVTEAEIAALRGAFVKVTGRLAGDISIRMAGPETIVATLVVIGWAVPR